jgi:hypothetical protein
MQTEDAKTKAKVRLECIVVENFLRLRSERD